jgi:hypothetical protein
MKGRHFDDTDDISIKYDGSTAGNSTKPVLKLFSRRWHRCIASQGEYFEGDHSDIQQ